MARIRIETAPQITVYDESAVFKAASGATAALAEFKNSSDAVVASISKDRKCICFWRSYS
jgi:hypothetical protein